MFYLIVAILLSLTSGYLFKKASGTISLHSPNMMSIIFYYYFLLNNVVGAILVVNKLDDHYIINKLSDDVYRVYGFWTIMYVIIGFPVGQLIANSIFRKYNMRSLYYSYMSKPISNDSMFISSHIRKKLLVLSVFSLLTVVYTMITIGGSPLGSLFGGADVEDMAIMRADANRNFGGNAYFKNVFGLLLTPFLSYVAYGYMKLNRTRFHRYWFWSMFVGSILMLTYDLEKSPLIWYLFGFVIYKVYMGNKLSNKTLLIIFSIATALIITMYVVLSSFDINNIFIFNQGIIGRLTLTSNAGVFMSYDLFPNNHDFIGFSSFSEFLCDVFGANHSERAARLVMEFVNQEDVLSGIAGVFNSLFVSEAWANWGIIGLIISPIYVGFIIQCLYLFILCHRKTPYFMALFVFYTINCAINGGINDYIYNISTLIIIILTLFTHSNNKKVYI